MALFACMEDRAKCTEQEFDAWLATYFKKFTNKSVQAWDLFAHYEDRFGKGLVNWNKWLYKAEMPEFWPSYDTSFIAPIKAGAKGVNWTTGAYMVYLDHLYSQPTMTIAQLNALNKKHNFDTSVNPEIIYRWGVLGVKSKREISVKMACDLLGSVGRMKFCRPIARCLLEHGYGDRAKAIFEKAARELYHPITTKMLRRDLKLE